MDISNRKRLILTKIVALHTDSGDPIGSRLLQEYLNTMSVSTATLRNEMAQLTAIGLLEQPHTSAGRVPTEQGYRYYLNNLMNVEPVSSGEMEAIREEVEKMDSDPDKAAEFAASSLAELSGLGAITCTPVGSETQMSYFDLMKVGRYNTAIMGITNLGSLKTRVCRTDSELTETEVRTLRTVINNGLRFTSSEDADEERISSMAAESGIMPSKALPIITSAAELLKGSKDVRVFRAGQGNLLKYRELSDHIDQTVRLFEQTKGLAARLSKDGGTEIFVGSELGEGFDSLSMVVSRYRVAGGGYGGLAVVGPVRMSYRRIVPRLSEYAKSMSEALATR